MQKTFILLALLAVYGACHSFSDNSKVLQLTVSDFTSVTGIGSGTITKNTFGMFYAPWCGHCKNLIPTYEQFAEKATDINVVAVDCTQNQLICSQLDVKGYPTLIYFTTEGKQVKYQKARSLDALVSFASTDYKTEESTDITFSLPSVAQQTVTAVASNIQAIVEDLSKRVGGPIPLAGGAIAAVLLLLAALSLLCKKKEVDTPKPSKEGKPKETKKRD